MTKTKTISEYCAMEDFKPTCGENTQQPTTFNNFRDRNKIQALNTPLHNTPTPKRRTAVRITKAFYGRMQLGRCIKKNFGYLGCYHDVTHVLNSYCAGSLDCHVRVPDAILEEGSVCTEDLTKYLSVQYECFEGGWRAGSMFGLLGVGGWNEDGGGE